MRRCEDGIGILVAESGEQEGASEEIAPLAKRGSDQICLQSAENRIRYGRTFAHEASSNVTALAELLIHEPWLQKM
jgi:hypothetical protein